MSQICVNSRSVVINTLRPSQIAAIFQTTFSNGFSSMKMYKFWLRFHWCLFPRVQFTIFHHWFRKWLGADQAISHYLNQWWLVYWRIYASLGLNELTPWGRVMHIYVSEFPIIGSDIGLLLSRCQAIIWTNVGILLIWPLGMNFSEILIKNPLYFHSRKCLWKCRLRNVCQLSRPHCVNSVLPNILSTHPRRVKSRFRWVENLVII